MKIKRFEAASMTDALRSIKQEFGEEAVILSAKSIKKTNGLLSGKRSSKVVVTAAVDPPSVSDKSRYFNPITRTGQLKLQSKFVRMDSESRKDKSAETVYQKLISQGVDDAIAKDFNKKVMSLTGSESEDPNEMRSALSHIMQAQKIVERYCHLDPSATRIVVLVGPSGAGKTTMAAKLAAMQVRQAPASAAFISLDDRRVAGCAELERYADILGIQLETAYEPDEVSPLVDKLRGHQLVVVDTPGLAADDKKLREHIRRMIAAMPKPEVHLLLNADCRNGALEKAVTFFRTVGVQFLGFTRLDWADTVGSLINQATNFDMPITYLSSTPKANQGTQWATADQLADLLLAFAPQTHSASDRVNSTLLTAQEGNSESIGNNYVANRNSDIFHKYDCQSVKRINSENMVKFNDPADAMGQKFKPCRMCCGELLVSKSIQRVAYKYASSR